MQQPTLVYRQLGSLSDSTQVVIRQVSLYIKTIHGTDCMVVLMHVEVLTYGLIYSWTSLQTGAYGWSFT